MLFRSPAKIPANPAAAQARALRHSLEAFHGKADPQAVAAAWPHLNSSDRYLRWAARVALEWQPPATWAAKALNETDAGKQVEALLGLARATGIDPQHRKATDAPVDTAMGAKLYAALLKLDWQKLSNDQRLTLVRACEI